ncbi:hypothetical protein TA3x_003643 [Tundrisphaera sp. TA3]|uniref:hypothetical protein n=1 Tax=Tundrisphaera sp. TA3 TaxID=3435775 RepID=UPI003EB9EE4D
MFSLTRAPRPAVQVQRRRRARPAFDHLDDRVMLSVAGGALPEARAIVGAPFPTSVVEFSVGSTPRPEVATPYATPSATTMADGSGTTLVSPMGSASPQGFRPDQISKAYGFDQAYLAGGIVGDGAGQTIVILNAYDNPNIVNDLDQFNRAFGLPAPPSFTIYKQVVDGTPPPTAPSDWALEIALDVQWAHAMAPAANIILASAHSASVVDLFDTAQYMAGQPGVSVISMSFGSGEWSGQTGTFGDAKFVTPAGHAGVTFVASSGDYGVISYPASSNRVLGIGGTRLTVDASNNYLGETGWSGSGGGTSQYSTKPSYQNADVAGAFRQSPDVSLVADPATGVAVYDSFNNGTVNPWSSVGGTSVSAPIWSSLIAIANQGRALNGLASLDGPSQTLPMLYQLPRSSFHDITTGSNGAGSAKVGYDVVTGLGSPKANLVIAGLSGTPIPTPGAPALGDGGFEQASLGGPGYAYGPAGSAWGFANGGGVARNGSGISAGSPTPDGSQFAFLQNGGSMSQSVAGWAAGSYTISFAAAKRSYAGDQDFRVLVDGVEVGVFAPSSSSFQAYRTATFTVGAGSHTITFQGLNSRGGDNTALVDAVAVASAAPPSSGAPALGDGGFEQASLGGPGYAYGPAGSAWGFANGGGVARNGSGISAGSPTPDGSQFAFLQNGGSMSQSVAGWAAGSYTISFAAAKRSYAGDQDFRVLVDGVEVGVFAPSSSSFQAYRTATFTVGAGSHTITFQGLNSRGGDNTALVDAVAVASAAPPSSGAPALGDGGFEQASLGGPGYAYGPAGSAWGFANGGGVARNGSGIAAGSPTPDGSQFAFLQNGGSMSQSVAGWAAGSYTISFAAAKRSYAGDQDFRVLVDGVEVGVFAPSSSSFQAYRTATFTVGAGSHTITFQGLNSRGGDNTALVDAVAVAPAPAAAVAISGKDAILLPLTDQAGSLPPVVRVGNPWFTPKVAAWRFQA